MRDALVILTFGAAILATSLTISYGLALEGEPSALWLMRDILGWL